MFTTCQPVRKRIHAGGPTVAKKAPRIVYAELGGRPGEAGKGKGGTKADADGGEVGADGYNSVVGTPKAGDGMRATVYYRVMTAPPGSGPDQKFMVGVYETLKYGSCVGSLRKQDGSGFAAGLEEARQMLPAGARQLPFTAEDQFLELWEGAELNSP